MVVIGIRQTGRDTWRLTYDGRILGDSKGMSKPEALETAKLTVRNRNGLAERPEYVLEQGLGSMSKREYVEMLAKLYYVANLSDARDNPARPAWLKGHECAAHCQAFDKIVNDLGLGEIWGNILEGDCLDQVL